MDNDPESVIIALMNFQLVTLTGTKVDQDVYEVILPTAAGEIAVFPGHEPIVGIVVPGAIAVRHEKVDPDSRLDYFAVSGGVLEVNPKGLKVLVDEADSGEDIVEAETKTALDRALKLRDTAKDQVELEKAHQLVDRHQVRLKVAELRRRHRR
jgi:F-type H+-transporting ATPase subunit epsilon